MLNTTKERDQMRYILLDDIERERKAFEHWNEHYCSTEDDDLRQAYARQTRNAYRRLSNAVNMYNELLSEEDHERKEEG